MTTLNTSELIDRANKALAAMPNNEEMTDLERIEDDAEYGYFQEEEEAEEGILEQPTSGQDTCSDEVGNKYDQTDIKREYRRFEESFIESLANPSGVPEYGKPYENMYAASDSVQRQNLALYLGAMLECKPEILLLGEAPGYRGCGRTGIPFTDEYHLFDESSGSRFGEKIGVGKRGYRLLDSQLKKLEKETSASIIWEALEEWETPPLLWNVFPYHPCTNDGSKTNRTPTVKEVAFGWKYVEELMREFNISADHVYCIGRTAHNALRAHRPLTTHCLRHPSYGGKTECVDQLAKLGKGETRE